MFAFLPMSQILTSASERHHSVSKSVLTPQAAVSAPVDLAGPWIQMTPPNAWVSKGKE